MPWQVNKESVAMANHSDQDAQKIGTIIKDEPTYVGEYCEVNMESDCVLGVDAVEVEILIDGRDVQNEESVGAGNSNEHSEDEISDAGNRPTPREKINPVKRKKHILYMDEEEHHNTGKRKRQKHREEINPCHRAVDDDKTPGENSSFECVLCQRKFSQKIYLNRHFMIHTGEKPYECEICHQRFNQKVNLNRHLATHTGEKPFKCNVCNFEFSQKVNLNRHLKTHTGEKPFRCNLCNFECNQKVNLQRHIKTHNSVEVETDDMMMYVKPDGIYVAKLY